MNPEAWFGTRHIHLAALYVVSRYLAEAFGQGAFGGDPFEPADAPVATRWIDLGDLEGIVPADAAFYGTSLDRPKRALPWVEVVPGRPVFVSRSDFRQTWCDTPLEFRARVAARHGEDVQVARFVTSSVAQSMAAAARFVAETRMFSEMRTRWPQHAVGALGVMTRVPEQNDLAPGGAHAAQNITVFDAYTSIVVRQTQFVPQEGA